jgi:hypothetical protein
MKPKACFLGKRQNAPKRKRNQSDLLLGQREKRPERKPKPFLLGKRNKETPLSQ